ncbi:putative trans-2-enoyl-CoA reductase, mitochondrial [Smittium culicis]|uniref:enoyl-[acyl-carrier-protein] reductase n=1 Tax=Smittium culicis TaxID=133412 RepID=A0A1R1YHU8_9FUNG|nr:putative trans-2-enoyl-CoA reductase, mitochondrial [Smittium culicis]
MKLTNALKSAWSKAAVFTEFGEPSSVLKFRNVKLGPVPNNKVLVKILVAPVNPSDVNQVQGVYPIKKISQKITLSDNSVIDGYIGGNEGVGQVIQVGSDVKSAINGQIKVGDYVIPMSTGSVGTWANSTIADPSSLVVFDSSITSKLSPEQIGSVKVNASTSYRMLRDIVHLDKGDYVVQNGANSSVGQILIQLAKLYGYKTINVIREGPNFESNKQLLLSLGADIVIKDSDLLDRDMMKSIKDTAASENKQIKLGVNCVCGKASVLMAKLLSNGGYFVTYGAMAKQPMAIPAALFIFKNITFKGYWVSSWYSSTHHSKWFEMWNELFDLYANNKLVEQKMEPILITPFDAADNAPLNHEADPNKVDLADDLIIQSTFAQNAKKSYFKFY